MNVWLHATMPVCVECSMHNTNILTCVSSFSQVLMSLNMSRWACHFTSTANITSCGNQVKALCNDPHRTLNFHMMSDSVLNLGAGGS